MPKQTTLQQEQSVKTCSACRQELTINNFYKNRGSSDGFCAQCIKCATPAIKKNYQQKREKFLEYKKQWYEKNKENQLLKLKKYYIKNRTKIIATRKEQRMQKLYGISLQEKEDMLHNQGNCCAICKSQTFTGSNWHIDHDHKTNKIRGILCGKCNHLIGLANDDTLILDAAIQYLQAK